MGPDERIIERYSSFLLLASRQYLSMAGLRLDAWEGKWTEPNLGTFEELFTEEHEFKLDVKEYVRDVTAAPTVESMRHIARER